MIFWTKFAPKGYFHATSEKMNTANKFCLFKSVRIPNFSLKWQLQIFWPNLPNKVFPVENLKIEQHHLILYIWISQGTKFLLKLTILIFLTKFTQRVSGQIGEKWTTYESHIFQISRYQTSASRIKFASKGYFQSKKRKSEQHH